MSTGTTNDGEYFYADDNGASEHADVLRWAKSATDRLSQLNVVIESDRIQRDVRVAMCGLVMALERRASQSPIRGRLHERALELADDIGVDPELANEQPDNPILPQAHVALEELLFDVDTEFPRDL